MYLFYTLDNQTIQCHCSSYKISTFRSILECFHLNYTVALGLYVLVKCPVHVLEHDKVRWINVNTRTLQNGIQIVLAFDLVFRFVKLRDCISFTFFFMVFIKTYELLSFTAFLSVCLSFYFIDSFYRSLYEGLQFVDTYWSPIETTLTSSTFIMCHRYLIRTCKRGHRLHILNPCSRPSDKWQLFFIHSGPIGTKTGCLCFNVKSEAYNFVDQKCLS